MIVHLHLQPCTSRLSSSSFRSPYFNYTSNFSPKPPQPVGVNCSISQVHSYGTMDYDKKPLLKWKSVYQNISFMDTDKLNPHPGSASLVNQWERDNAYSLSKWELCRIVKELRKYKRYSHALEVYEWMNNKPDRFRLSTSDAAIQLDLIAKVRGVPSAETFFGRLPDGIKDKRIYGALQNSYAEAKMREEAEMLMEQMRERGYCNHALPFNVMMSLYMKFKAYDKVESVVSEMMGKNVKLDIYTYNIWLSCRGAQGCAERMEHVFEQLKLDSKVYPNWTSFSIMATMYTNMGEVEKAEDCLRKIEGRMTGWDRLPYHYLFSLYGTIGKKDEVYRLWKTYRSLFPSTPNVGYVAVVASLIRVGDIGGAEKMYEEWVAGKRYYDVRIPNLLMGVYVREGNMEKAESLFSRMLEDEGGKSHPRTWEILAEGHIAKRKIAEALCCLKEAFSAVGSTGWRLRPVNMLAFSSLCEEEGESTSKETLDELVRQSGSLDDQVYASSVGLSGGAVTVSAGQQSEEQNAALNEEDGSEIFLNQTGG